MFISDLLVALVTATVFVAVLGGGVRRLPLGRVLLGMYAVLFLVTWAGGIWLTPPAAGAAVGPLLPFLVVGLVIALIMTALIPRHPPRTRGEALRRDDAKREIGSFVNLFFWLVVLVLVVVIALRYL
jgi:hypothetical protein